MRERQIFDNFAELKQFIFSHPDRVAKRTPWRVFLNGKERYCLAGNSDQAIAAVARQNGVRVESVGMTELLTRESVQ